MRRLLAVVAVASLVAGCGSSSDSKQSAASAGSSPGGAAVAPLSTQFLLRLNTAFDSPQWAVLDMLLKKFPDGEQLFADIAGGRASLDRDVKPALGSETDLIALTAADLDTDAFLGLTQPKDQAKLDALLARGTDKPVSEQIANWRVIADERATIDRFKTARNEGTLADSEAYAEATAGLPADALARLYVNGAVLTRAIDKQAKTGAGPIPGVGRIGWLAGALTALEQGFGLDVRLKGDEIEASPFAAELPKQVPADVSLFADFKGLDALLDELKRNPQIAKQLGSAEQALGGLLDELIALFKSEGAFYVRQQGAVSEYTFVLDVADEQGAAATLDKLGTLLGALAQKAPEPVSVAGVAAKKLAFGKTFVYYAVFDGKLAVTNVEAGIEGLKAGGERLADSQAWRDATAAAAMPETTAGLLYADVQRIVPLLQRVSASKAFSPEVERNLEPLGTALVFGSVDGIVASLKGFVSVR